MLLHPSSFVCLDVRPSFPFFSKLGTNVEGSFFLTGSAFAVSIAQAAPRLFPFSFVGSVRRRWASPPRTLFLRTLAPFFCSKGTPVVGFPTISMACRLFPPFRDTVGEAKFPVLRAIKPFFFLKEWPRMRLSIDAGFAFLVLVYPFFFPMPEGLFPLDEAFFVLRIKFRLFPFLRR